MGTTQKEDKEKQNLKKGGARFSNLASLRGKSAFTLIEVIISIAILAVVSTVGFLALTSYKGGKNIELTMNELVAVIRDAQRRSITEQDGKQWGLHFINSTSTAHSYEMFNGASYTPSTVSSTYSLKRSVAFSNPSEGLNVDTIFSAISGKLGETRIISLISQRRDNLVGDVTMLSQGTITTRLETGVVGYWHLDEATSTNAYDASGNTNTGTFVNNPTWQSVSNCKAGACLSFDGTNDYITVPDSSSLDITGSITISAWVYKTTNHTATLITKSGNYQFSVINDNTIQLCYLGCRYSNSVLTNDEWQHIAAVKSGNTITFYRNGSFVNSLIEPTTPVSNTNPVVIGGNTGLQYLLDGRLDEVRIYNRALTATEILNHYNDLK